MSRPQEVQKLRVGLFIDSFIQPSWVARVVSDIVGSAHSEIVLVALRDAPRPPRRFARLWADRRLWLWIAYQALDKRVFRVRPDPFENVDIAPVLGAAPIVRVTSETASDRADLPDDVTDTIAAHRLDVALRFGSWRLRGRALGLARYGVWSFEHGDDRDGPPGYWEVVERHRVTGSQLRVLTRDDPDDGRVLYRSWAATDPRSVARNNGHRYWQSAAFVDRQLRLLHQNRALEDEGPTDPRDAEGAHRLHDAPGNGEVAAAVWSFTVRSLRDKIPELFARDQWTLAYGIGAASAVDPSAPVPVAASRLTPLIPPRDRFWADPFVLPNADGWLIFFEELMYASGKGHISAVQVSRDGIAGASFRVLERDYHLSYPCVFEWNGAVWMVPETRANRTVELYRATDLPRGWTLDRVLLRDLQAVDATIVDIADRWWMFVNIAEPGAWTDDELHLFHASTPLGPWTPHRRNPVKSDVRSARPAGRPFQHDGVWYRPAQDCSTRYGGGIAISRIEEISEREYRETEVSRLDPLWRRGLNGTHTINAAAGLTVIDARIRSRRFPSRSG